MIPVAAYYGGGALLALLVGLRIRAVEKKHAGSQPVASPAGVIPPPPSPQQVAAVTPAQVQKAADAAGVSVPQLAAAAQAAGTTPQAVIAAAQNAGSSVADAILAQASGQAAAAAPQLQAAISPDPAAPVPRVAKVTTNDPAPAGDLLIRSSPDDSADIVGSAEKDGNVTVVVEDAGNGYSQVGWAGGDRLPAAQGFAHSKFLVGNFNGDGFIDINEAHGQDYR